MSCDSSMLVSIRGRAYYGRLRGKHSSWPRGFQVRGSALCNPVVEVAKVIIARLLALFEIIKVITKAFFFVLIVGLLVI